MPLHGATASLSDYLFNSNLNLNVKLKFQLESSVSGPGVTVTVTKQHEAQRGWGVLWLPLAGAVSRLSFVSALLLPQVLQTISEATGTASAWVVHIQVARGKSTAVESGTSESRAAARGVRGFKFTVVPVPLPVVSG